MVTPPGDARAGLAARLRSICEARAAQRFRTYPAGPAQADRRGVDGSAARDEPGTAPGGGCPAGRGRGVPWYTRLEQGRDITVSSNVLDVISTVLRLSLTRNGRTCIRYRV